MRSFWPTDRLIGGILPVLAIIAEGALLAVVYVAVQTALDHRQPLLGTLELAAAAGIAATAARRRWLDPDEDAVPFLLLLGALGLVGWMWDADVRRLVLEGDLVGAMPLHPGGWLMVVAGMRGVGRGIEIDDRALTRLVLIGVPALAIPWTLGQLAAGDLRPVFTEEAFVASITFVTAGFIAAGLARLVEIGRETGVDWRQDRSWLGTVFGVIGVVLALGIPATFLLGLPGDAVARGILGPIVSLLAYIIAFGLALAAMAAFFLSRLLRSFGIQLPDPAGDPPLPIDELRTLTMERIGPLITGLIALWVVIIVVLIVLGRIWLRRRVRRPGGAGFEERSFRIPQRSSRVRAGGAAAIAAARPGRPHDAVTAYLAALDDLATNDPADTHAEHETPRGHARRVDAGPELVALQADYALARYGGRSITDAENRRALARWRRLRERLTRRR